MDTDNTQRTTLEEYRFIKQTDSVVDSIIDQFVERASFGKTKYGVDMDREDLSILEWIEHAKQEHMDAILYLEKIKQEYIASGSQEKVI